MTNNEFRLAMLAAPLVIAAALVPLAAGAQPWPDLHQPAQMSCANAVGCLGQDFTNWVDNTPAGGLSGKTVTKPTTPPPPEAVSSVKAVAAGRQSNGGPVFGVWHASFPARVPAKYYARIVRDVAASETMWEFPS